MLGWKLFAKAVTLVTDNLGLALRVSLVPYLAAILGAGLLLGGVGATGLLADPAALADGAAGAGVSGAAVLALLLAALLFAVASLWVAVAWHRATLLEEPVGWVPPFHGGAILGYLGRSILLALAILLVYMAIALVVGLVAAAVPPVALLLGAVGVIFVIVLFYRLALILPAGAVERPIGFAEAWRATEGASAAILLLAVLTFALSILLQLPGLLVGGGLGAMGDPAAAATGGLLSMVYGVVVQWVLLMVGVSALTVLYGHFVEDRPL